MPSRDPVGVLAERLFKISRRIGAAKGRTSLWLLNKQQWQEVWLTPDFLSDGSPMQWGSMNKSQKWTWRKLARIFMYAMPIYEMRAGSLFMEQAKAIRSSM